jgi:hypothetical protein
MTFRAVALLAMVAVAACAGNPASTKSTAKKKSTTTATSKVSPVKAQSSPSAKPSAMPSLGLVLTGQVAVEPGALLAGNLAKTTATGVKLISDNGLGLISDNGLGLISDNGAGLISDNGLGIISNNSGGYRIQSLGTGLKPVEGMLVSAVSLLDGRVLAGPVASKADGSYKLGFYKAQERNMRIVVTVPKHEKDAQYTYETLIPPTDKPIVTSDTTRAVADYTIGALEVIFQPYIEIAKSQVQPSVQPKNEQVTKDFAAILMRIGPTKIAELDGADGRLTRAISERIVSYTDLTAKPFDDFVVVAEKVRVFGASLEKPVTPALLDQAIPLLRHKDDLPLVAALFSDRGMPEADAMALATELKTKGDAVGQMLVLALLAHQTEIFAPFEAIAKQQDQAKP